MKKVSPAVLVWILLLTIALLPGCPLEVEPPPVELPAPPEGLILSGVRGGVQLQWSPVADATEYTIYRGLSSWSGATSIGTCGGTEYLDATVNPKATHEYAVSAVRGDLEGEICTPKSITYIPPAYGPAQVISESSTERIVLTWPPMDSAYRYRVYRSESEQDRGVLLASTDVPTYTDAALLFGKTFHYRIYGTNRFGGVSEDYATISVLSEAPLKAPFDGHVSATADRIKLEWSAREDALSFEVYRSTSGEDEVGTLIDTVVATSYIDTTYPPEADEVYYAVYAVNGAERSDTALRLSAAPIAVRVMYTTDRAIGLSWTFPLSSLSGIGTGFEVYRSESPAEKGGRLWNQVVPHTASGSWVDTDVMPDVAYYYTIERYFTKHGQVWDRLALSTEASVVPTFDVETLVRSERCVSISWIDAPQARSYRVFRWTDDRTAAEVFYEGTATSTEDVSVTELEPFHYAVLGLDADGKTVVAGEAHGTVELRELPTSIDAQQTSYREVGLSWTAVDEAEAFRIRRSEDDGASWDTCGTTTALEYDDDSVTAPNSYTYEVISLNADGARVGAATTDIDLVLLDAPSDFDAVPLDGSTVQITWDPQPAADGYRLYRSVNTDSGYELLIDTIGTQYDDEDLAQKTEYFYRLYPYDALGQSTAYASDSAAGKYVLPAVKNLRVTETSGSSFDATWDPLPDASEYWVRFVKLNEYGNEYGYTYSYKDVFDTEFTGFVGYEHTPFRVTVMAYYAPGEAWGERAEATGSTGDSIYNPPSGGDGDDPGSGGSGGTTPSSTGRVRFPALSVGQETTVVAFADFPCLTAKLKCTHYNDYIDEYEYRLYIAHSASCSQTVSVDYKILSSNQSKSDEAWQWDGDYAPGSSGRTAVNYVPNDGSAYVDVYVKPTHQ